MTTGLSLITLHMVQDVYCNHMEYIFFFVCEPHHGRLLCEGRKTRINIDPIPPPDRRRCQSESCRSGTQGVGLDGLS